MPTAAAAQSKFRYHLRPFPFASGTVRQALRRVDPQTRVRDVTRRPSTNALDFAAVRNEKVKVITCIKPIVDSELVLGQYTAGNGQEGYLEDPGVPQDSKTPTFAMCVLHVDNARWRGVPFIIKAGKVPIHAPTLRTDRNVCWICCLLCALDEVPLVGVLTRVLREGIALGVDIGNVVAAGKLRAI